MQEPLYSPCPVQNCRNNNGGFRTYWHHGSCGGRVNIRYSDITIVCANCATRYKMFDWRFSCCGSDHGYTQGSIQGWLTAFSIMGQLGSTSQQNIRTAIRQLSSYM